MRLCGESGRMRFRVHLLPLKLIFFGHKLHRFRPVTPTTSEIFVTGTDAIGVSRLGDGWKGENGIAPGQFIALPTRCQFISKRSSPLITGKARSAYLGQTPLNCRKAGLGTSLLASRAEGRDTEGQVCAGKPRRPDKSESWSFGDL